MALQMPDTTEPLRLFGVQDSDWGSDRHHRRSITGIAQFLGGSVIAYKMKIQPVVALSSTEAEFYAASEAGKMALYLQSVLTELGYPQEKLTILYEDNSGC